MNKILTWLVCIMFLSKKSLWVCWPGISKKITMIWRHLFVTVQNTRTWNEQNTVNKHKITQLTWGTCTLSLKHSRSLKSKSTISQSIFTFSHSRFITNFYKHLLIWYLLRTCSWWLKTNLTNYVVQFWQSFAKSCNLFSFF